MHACLLFALALHAFERPATLLEAPFHTHSGHELRAWVETGSARLAARLETSWAERPEWSEMLLSLLKGEELSAGKGWYLPSEDVRGWEWLRARFDRNADDKVFRGELGAAAVHAEALDADHDGAITAADFWSRVDAGRDPAAGALFTLWDEDRNGKVSWDELSWFYQKGDRGKRGFLSRADLERALGGTLRPASGAGGPASPPPSPPQWAGIGRLLQGELGDFTEGPAPGAPAPDFELPALEGGKLVRPGTAKGKKPVVLAFGGYSCGPFRAQLAALQELARRHASRVDVYLVYVREPHPVDGWRLESNDRAEVCIPAARSMEERAAAARDMCRRYRLELPVLLDTMDNAVSSLYSGFPDRLYLIGRNGRIAHKGGRGPIGFDVEALERALLLELVEEDAEVGREVSRG